MKVWRAWPALLVLAGCELASPAKSAAERQLETARQEEQPDRLLERGRAFAVLNDNARAEQYLAAALDRGADPRKVLPILLRVCIAEQRYRVAIQYAEPELRRNPDDYRLRFVVASLYQSIGETETARAELQKVTETKPDHAEAHYALAVLARDDMDDPVEADRHFREYLRIRPDGPHAREARASLLKVVEPRPADRVDSAPEPVPEARP